MDEPYAPPKAQLGPTERRGSVVLGVVVGFLADVVATLGFAVVALVIAGIFLATQPEIQQDSMAAGAELERMLNSPGGEAVMLTIGLVATFVGGFVGAWVANRLELHVGAIVGVASILLGVVVEILSDELGRALWIELLGWALPVPLATAGGWLRKKWRESAG